VEIRGKWKLPVADTSPFPLWNELTTVATRKTSDLIIVDDVHAFGRDENGWQSVSQASLDQWFGDRLVKSAIFGDQYLAATK